MDPFNSKFILKEKRWLWIDYDKGISIILVAYGHCMAGLNDYVPNLHDYPFFNYINYFLYGFRMPLFFVVSGLLVARSLNKKGLKNYILDRTNNILVPLVVWGSLTITIFILIARFTNYTHHEQITAKFYLYLIINPVRTGTFWYLNALFSIGVIYAVLRVKLKITPLIQVLIGAILYCVSAYVQIHNIGVGFLLHVFEYYFFFALGDLISKVMLEEKNIQKFTSWKIFAPLFALFLIVQYFLTEINLKSADLGMYYVEQKLPFLYLISALVGCTLSISFSFLLQKYKVVTFIRIIGYHSLFVYCMQMIAMLLIRIICWDILKITYVPLLIGLIWSLGVVLPIFFYNFSLRHNLWWLYTYRKPEKQVEYLRANNIFSLKWG
jgi:fucose 4-O-acetylase-like acetyltransferase